MHNFAGSLELCCEIAAVVDKRLYTAAKMILCWAAAASTKGRQRCDDIKAQLDAVSVQIKQAERAQHDPVPDRHDSPDALSPSSTHVPNSRSVSPSDSVKPLGVGPRHHGGRARSQTPPKRAHHAQRGGETEEEHSAQQQAKRPKPASADQVSGRTANGGKARPAAKGNFKRPAEHIAAGEAKRHKQNHREPKDGKPDEPDQARPADLPGLKQKRRLLYGQLQEARQQVGHAMHAMQPAKCCNNLTRIHDTGGCEKAYKMCTMPGSKFVQPYPGGKCCQVWTVYTNARHKAVGVTPISSHDLLEVALHGCCRLRRAVRPLTVPREGLGRRL